MYIYGEIANKVNRSLLIFFYQFSRTRRRRVTLIVGIIIFLFCSVSKMSAKKCKIIDENKILHILKSHNIIFGKYK